ncbi:MAG: hypothetical protein JWN06_2344 [Propionibacteriaceae bacterium]|nr:hypothetical protein [Propionibacteriaceae bacterium]
MSLMPAVAFWCRTLRLVRRVSSEPTPGLNWDQRPIAAGPELLYGPAVAIGIGEAKERSAVALIEHRDLAGLNTAVQKLPLRGLSVRNDELQSMH